jgi:type IV secretion system protein VirD4
MRTLRKAIPVIITMMLGFWAANLIGMRIRIDLEAGADASAIINHLAAAFDRPLTLGTQTSDLLAGLGGAACVGLAWLYRWGMRRNWREGEEYGSARWARADEMAPYTDHDPAGNIQMTATEGLSIDAEATHRNRNTGVLGSSGSGKTSGHVIPNIRRANMNYACTDPKGELYDRTHADLKQAGYTLRKLDLVDLRHDGDQDEATFNPLDYIDAMKPDVAIMHLVSNLMANTNDGSAREHQGDGFWDKAERSLLTALTAYVYYTGVNPDDPERPEELVYRRTLNAVADLAGRMESSEEDETRMSIVDAEMRSIRTLHASFDPAEWDEESRRVMDGLKFAADQYRPFEQGAGETKKSIIISLGVRLAPLQVRAVREILATDTIGIRDFARPGRRTAIFLALPDEDPTFNFLAAIFYQCLFDQIIASCRDLPGGRLPRPLHCYLDEFANIGRIPNFERLISTIRSRDVSVSIILQTIGQLKSMYKDDWETIMGNCDNILFLGGSEQSTTEWISKLLGKATIDTRETSDTKGMNGSHTVSYRRTGRELLTPDELAQMSNDRCIYMLRGVRPFLSRKIKPGTGRFARPHSTLRHSEQWVL